MKKELLIYFIIFVVLTITIHFSELITHPFEHILNLSKSGAYGLGAVHPNQLLEDLEKLPPTPTQPVVEDKPPLFNDSIFEIPFNMALDMCIGLINQHISMLAAVGKCNEDFDQTRKNIVDSISKLKK